MNLVMIVGPGCVGEMTVAQELIKLTRYKLFHNHMTIDPVINILGHIDWHAVSAFREMMWEKLVNDRPKGIVATYMMDFSRYADYAHLAMYTRPVRRKGGKVVFVELNAPLDVRIDRLGTANRLANKPSQRDIPAARERLMRDQECHRFESEPGEITIEPHLKYNTAEMTAEDIAKEIYKELLKL